MQIIISVNHEHRRNPEKEVEATKETYFFIQQELWDGNFYNLQFS